MLETISLSAHLAKQKHALPESLRERLDVVEVECERALRIIRDLLLLARRNPPERTRVDLDEIVRATLALHAAELERHCIRVVTDLENAPPIWADPHQLKQVLLNLFTNATHAMTTSDGRGELTVRSSREGGDAQLEIEDDGPGIPAEYLGRIFDPFFTTKSADEGTGLGLSLSNGHRGGSRREDAGRDRCRAGRTNARYSRCSETWTTRALTPGPRGARASR